MSRIRPRNPFLAALALTAGQMFITPGEKLQASQDVVKTAMPLPPAANRMLKMQRRMITVKTRTPDPLRLAAAQAKRERRQQRNLRLAQKQQGGV